MPDYIPVKEEEEEEAEWTCWMTCCKCLDSFCFLLENWCL